MGILNNLLNPLQHLKDTKKSLSAKDINTFLDPQHALLPELKKKPKPGDPAVGTAGGAPLALAGAPGGRLRGDTTYLGFNPNGKYAYPNPFPAKDPNMQAPMSFGGNPNLGKIAPTNPNLGMISGPKTPPMGIPQMGGGMPPPGGGMPPMGNPMNRLPSPPGGGIMPAPGAPPGQMPGKTIQPTSPQLAQAMALRRLGGNPGYM